MMTLEREPAGAEAEAAAVKSKPEVIYRHGRLVRVTHWVNFACVALLLMSGLQIFNAHPMLYFGARGADGDPAWLSLTATQRPGREIAGLTRIGSVSFHTTGWLGVSAGRGGEPMVRGFPEWSTLPSWQDLATGRRWHFFLAWILVANGLVFLVAGFASGHFHKDLTPKPREVAPRRLWRSIVDHALLRRAQGEEAKHYNVLQKFAYLTVIFLLLPLMVLTGLCMSPGFDAFAPWLVDLFGGRQTARSIHFITASAVVLFVLVHLIEVVVEGPWNEVRSMITGRYVVRPSGSNCPPAEPEFGSPEPQPVVPEAQA
ncbi:MAG TPA: cytochrome b/b6 domain-containing protein [Caulobacteraceae bacterium]|nr:cytochrome b/b6 domain-containing protein [Caulobacteraceae bacterium]